jgi:RNA polymerase sigma-70 factor (ECF subfamily)
MAAPAEVEIKDRVDAGDHPAAIEAVIRTYGPEVVSYLAGVMRASDDDVGEVFAMFCENVCRGLPRFRFESSVRTWAYVIARRAALEYQRGNRRRARRFDGPDGIEAVANAVQTTTLQHLRTTNLDRLEAVREGLDPEERAILILRVDRQLAWRDVAIVMADGDGELDDEALRKREAALRKKFDTIKRHLRDALTSPT